MSRMRADTEQWLAEVAEPDYRERLKAALKARRMSQRQFAELAGTSASNISFLLNAEYAQIPKYIWATARRLGLLPAGEGQDAPA